MENFHSFKLELDFGINVKYDFSLTQNIEVTYLIVMTNQFTIEIPYQYCARTFIQADYTRQT